MRESGRRETGESNPCRRQEKLGGRLLGPSVLPDGESLTEQEHGGKAQAETNTPSPALCKARVI